MFTVGNDISLVQPVEANRLEQTGEGSWKGIFYPKFSMMFNLMKVN